ALPLQHRLAAQDHHRRPGGDGALCRAVGRLDPCRRAGGAARRRDRRRCARHARSPFRERSEMKDWDEIRQWRKAKRAELLAQRVAIPRSEKLFRRPIIANTIAAEFPELRHACIGFYWPIKSEIDL